MEGARVRTAGERSSTRAERSGREARNDQTDSATPKLSTETGSLSTRWARQPAGSVRPDRSQPRTPGRGRSGGGDATRSPSSRPARLRLTTPSRRAPSDDTTSSGSPTSMPVKLPDIPRPTETVTTVKTKPAIASGRLSTAYQRSRRARRLNGSRSSRSTPRLNSPRSRGVWEGCAGGTKNVPRHAVSCADGAVGLACCSVTGIIIAIPARRDKWSCLDTRGTRVRDPWCRHPDPRFG